MDCWEFHGEFTYQQIECTTMSQFEFDKINSRDEVDRKNALGYRDSLKGEFFDFDFDFSFFSFNKKRLKSLHPNTK